jgi:hypothetical protein
MPIAFRPRSNSSAISSRYGSLVLAERWLPCAEAAPEGKKPVITEVAAFGLLAGGGPPEPVVTSMAGFELSEPVITKVAAFARDFSPQLPGDRM